MLACQLLAMETKLGNQRKSWAKRGHEVDDFTAMNDEIKASRLFT
jgi:hypothetical protein